MDTDFLLTDLTLQELKNQKIIYEFPLLKKFPQNEAGIYTLHGGIMVGKTTLLKLWMQKLLQSGIMPETLFFLEGSLIKDYRELQKVIQKQLASMPKENLLYLIVDDISSIRDWQKAIKTLLEKDFNRVVLMLAGIEMDAASIKVSRHFHLYPLSFRETVALKTTDEPTVEFLSAEFNRYLIHGGYLVAINEVAKEKIITDKTLKKYIARLTQETIEQNKQERYLFEMINAIYRHYNQKVSWNSLSQELTIEHPKTIGDYINFLERIDAVFVQYALAEKTLKAAPKKARKLMFTDPFIFHAMHAFRTPGKNYYETEIPRVLADNDLCSRLVESVVIGHFQRFFPTYYIKEEGEVELAYVEDQRFWPIEITWASQIRAKDFKQILKYQNSRIFTKAMRSGIIEHIRTEPLPQALWQLDEINRE